MKKWLYVNLVIAATLILGACSTSNTVVSNKLISKRKYTKGFHINKKAHLKDSDETLATEDLKEGKEKRRFDRKNNTNKVEIESEAVVAATKVSEESTSEVEYTTEANYETSYYGADSYDQMDGDEEVYVVNEVNEVEGPSELSEVDVKNSGSSSSRPDDTVMLILLVILALILPPVAIAIYRGIDMMFWLDLILFLLGGGLGIGLGAGLGLGLGGLCWLAAVVIAFLVIFDVI